MRLHYVMDFLLMLCVVISNRVGWFQRLRRKTLFWTKNCSTVYLQNASILLRNSFCVEIYTTITPLFVSRKKFGWGHLKPKWVKLCMTYPDANNVKLSTIVINRILLSDQTSEILARPICNFYAAAVRFVLWAMI